MKDAGFAKSDSRPVTQQGGDASDDAGGGTSNDAAVSGVDGTVGMLNSLHALLRSLRDRASPGSESRRKTHDR